CSATLREMGAGSQSMEEVSRKIVGYLYNHLGHPTTGEKSCALVRLYKTHAYAQLDSDLQAFAGSLLGETSIPPDTKCLTLLATVGDNPEWHSRKNSAGHKAIPLPSDTVIQAIPMLARLIQQFGLEINDLVQPDPSLLSELEQKTYNVFHVPEAPGSPFIPAQEQFVVPYGIKSVLGFGGMLPAGDLLAIIIFSKVPIPPETAHL